MTFIINHWFNSINMASDSAIINNIAKSLLTHEQGEVVAVWINKFISLKNIIVNVCCILLITIHH